MNFEEKYNKYKMKYVTLKKLLGGVGENEKTIHIYNGGSFSPPTLAHQQICIDTFSFLMNHFKDSSIDNIVLHLVPTSDMYDKPSVKHECIKFIDRVKMLEIMAQNVREKISSIQKNKDYNLHVRVDNFEQKVSYESKSDGSSFNGYIGTYRYLIEFAKRNRIKNENIYLLYGLDNGKSLLTSTKISENKYKRWTNPLHLVSKFKFLKQTFII